MTYLVKSVIPAQEAVWKLEEISDCGMKTPKYLENIGPVPIIGQIRSLSGRKSWSFTILRTFHTVWQAGIQYFPFLYGLGIYTEYNLDTAKCETSLKDNVILNEASLLAECRNPTQRITITGGILLAL